MTRNRKDWGFRATSRSAVPEAIFATISVLVGNGVVLAGLLIFHQFQILNDLQSLPSETARRTATGRADVASVRPVAGPDKPTLVCFWVFPEGQRAGGPDGRFDLLAKPKMARVD